MVDYEKGTPSWDVGMILTRHFSPLDARACARVQSLRSTVGMLPEDRLAQALATECSCGHGDSDAERTSLKKKEQHGDPDAHQAAGVQVL